MHDQIIARLRSLLQRGISVGDTIVFQQGTMTTLGRWHLASQTLGPDLYGGHAGLAFALAEIARATGDAQVSEVAVRTARAAREQIADHPVAGVPSFYSGAAGVGWMLLQLADLQPSFATDGEAIFRAAVKRTETFDDAHSDYLTGLAGMACGALACRHSIGDEALVWARAFASRVKMKAIRHDDGACWEGLSDDPSRPDTSPLCGLSHGAGGIAASLALVDHFCGTGDHAELIAEAVRWEDQQFDDEQNNWPDFRQGGRRFPAFWCHGAGGQAFAYGTLSKCGPPAVRDSAATRVVQAQARICTALEDQQPLNHSLCHGRAGLIAALDPVKHFEIINEVHCELREITQSGDWLVGLGDGAVPLPGLLLGWSGIFLSALAGPLAPLSILNPWDLVGADLADARCRAGATI